MVPCIAVLLVIVFWQNCRLGGILEEIEQIRILLEGSIEL